MNNGNAPHPDDRELLLFLDGEAADRDLRRIKQHLDSCWTCRMHADQIQNTIVEYTRYRARTPIPEPPREWSDLSDEFRGIAAQYQPRSFWNRIRSTARASRAVLLTCGVTALAASLWFTLPRQPAEPPPPNVALPAPLPEPVVPEPIRPPSVHPPTKTLAEPPASIEDELKVIAMLHDLKADLGEPIELARTHDGRLAITGSGLSPRRQEVIRNALANAPKLDIHFAEVDTAPSSARPPAFTSAVPRPIAFEQQLLKYTGGRHAFEGFTNAVLDASDRLTMHAQALRKLNERFSPAAVLHLDAAGRQTLQTLRSDHRHASHDAAQELNRMLAPMYDILRIAPQPGAPASFPQMALWLDQLLNAALAGARSDLTDAQLYIQIRSLLAQISKELNAE